MVLWQPPAGLNEQALEAALRALGDDGPGQVMLQDLDWHGPGLAPDLIARLAERVPALTAVKVPGGGVDWPSAFQPQQASVPFVRRPQLWWPPALTAVKLPAGGEAWVESRSAERRGGQEGSERRRSRGAPEH